MDGLTGKRTFSAGVARFLGMAHPALRRLARSGYFSKDLEGVGRERILLLACGWVGDSFWASQVARPLAERFGGGSLWVATSPRARDLWRGIIADERVLELPDVVSDRTREEFTWQGLWIDGARLREHAFDVVLDLTGNRYSALAAFMARPGRAIGFGGDELSHLYSLRVPDPPRGSHLCLRPWHVAAPLLGQAPPSELPLPQGIPLPESVAGRWKALEKLGLPPKAAFAVLAPGAGWPSKQWPPERFAKLAEALEEMQFEVVAVGAEGDRSTCEAVVKPTRRGRVVAGAPLHQLTVLLDSARLVISNDSAVGHLAAATGTPTLALFNATNPAYCAPLGPRARVLRSGCPHQPEGSVHHCHGTPNFPCPPTCWDETTVKRVLGLCRQLLLS